MNFQDQVPNLGLDLGPAWPPGRSSSARTTESSGGAIESQARAGRGWCLAPSGPAARQPRPEDSTGGSESNSSRGGWAIGYEKWRRAITSAWSATRRQRRHRSQVRSAKRAGGTIKTHVGPPDGKHQQSRANRVFGSHRTFDEDCR